jgi:predicted O-methyltransferase YrrM
MARLWDLRRRPLFHLVLWRLGCARAETQTTEAERDCLARHAAGGSRIAEIGVYHGVTTRRLKSVMDPAGVIVAIDPFPKQRLGFSAHRIIARRQVLTIKSGTVRWMRTTGSQAAKELLAENSRCFDFVFVDGDHSWDGLKSDWEGWRNLIAPSGIVALHDSRLTPIRSLEGAGSVLYVQQVISKDPCFVLVDAVDSLTVFKRRNDSAV